MKRLANLSMLQVKICCVILLQFSVGCLAAERGRHHTCKSSCYAQNGVDDDRLNRDACLFDYQMTNDVCRSRTSPKLDLFGQLGKADKNLLRVKSWPIDALHTAVDFSLQVNVTGEVALIFNGLTDQKKEARCLMICFESRSSSLARTTTLGASCVKFPNGKYNVTVLVYVDTTSAFLKRSGSSCRNLKEAKPESFGRGAAVWSHSRMSFPEKVPSYPGDKKHNRVKRNETRVDLWTNLNETNNFDTRCPCFKCLNTWHTYDNQTASLRLLYGINSTYECCNDCSSLNLKLYQYVPVKEEKICRGLNFTTSVISGLVVVTKDMNVTKGPIKFPNIGTGCYAFRLRPMINPLPIYHGFLWLRSVGNVTNMNDWNTTFYMQPYPDESSLEVRWTAPTFPYNFSRYELQLWYHKDKPIKCRGENIYDGPIVVIPKAGKISLATTRHNFHNLSSGWYCARVTPVDHRCPPDGCEPRSSLSKMLKEPRPCCEEEDPEESILPVLVGAAAGVLIAGVVLACVVLRCRASRNFFKVAYTKVSGGGRLGDVQEVLLVWTAAGADGSSLLPVIQAFRGILMSYGRCKVYDYTDLRSIPVQQREHLLASPTAWLDSLLNQHKVKIVLVGTEGGRTRQLQCMSSSGGNREELAHLQPQDTQLFPYLLRRIQDRPDLASDYSRVFHVRFSDISSDRAELEGVVSWTRYRLPHHLRSLVLALHEIKEEDGSFLEEPTMENLQSLQKELAIHPCYGNRKTTNNNFNDINHLEPSALSISNEKSPFTEPDEETENRALLGNPYCSFPDLSKETPSLSNNLSPTVTYLCNNEPFTDNNAILPLQNVVRVPNPTTHFISKESNGERRSKDSLIKSTETNGTVR